MLIPPPLESHNVPTISSFNLIIYNGGRRPITFLDWGNSRRRSSSSSHHPSLCRAIERESSSSSSSSRDTDEFEVDTDKAREALRKLDEQLQSLSRKQQLVNSPLIPPPQNNNITARDLEGPQPRMREEAPDFSGSFLPYSAFALLLFSIFYNVLFITVIKPSIDLPEAVEAISERNVPPAVLMPQSPLYQKL